MKKRTLSKKARLAISNAQKARWAKRRLIRDAVTKMNAGTTAVGQGVTASVTFVPVEVRNLLAKHQLQASGRKLSVENMDKIFKKAEKMGVILEPEQRVGMQNILHQKGLLETVENSMVNHPKHYGGDTTYEVIKVLEAWELGRKSLTSGFNLGNAVKYIARSGRKENYVEDLKKAAWYLNREIENAYKE